VPAAPLGAIHFVADLDALDASPSGLKRVRALLAAGLPSLQVRAPDRPPAERLRRGRLLARLARRAGAILVVNGDVDVAIALAADGLHLPARGPRTADVRSRLPRGMLLGRSCHDADELRAAEGCDWVIVSPVFATPSKPAAAPLGEAGLARLVAASPAPVYALGGVGAHGARACFRAGAAGVAAIRALLAPGGEELVRLARELAGEAR
jgi:thiamine-phosphate diphosphorylase